MFDGLSLDSFALLDEGCRPAEVDIGGRHVVQAHPERDWTEARRRLATLNKLIAGPPRPRAH
jgi:hypothetical protein